MNKPFTKRERKQMAAARSQAKLARARDMGVLGGAKDGRIAGRVSSKLIAVAKERAGTTSDTDVLEIALATLALEDDYVERLLRLKGKIPQDIDFGI